MTSITKITQYSPDLFKQYLPAHDFIMYNETSFFTTMEQLKNHMLTNKEILNIKDTNGNNMLILATNNNNVNTIEIINMLLDMGININEQNNMGISALISAACYSSIDVIKLLISKRCDVNLRSSLGTTAVMFACMTKRNDIYEKIELLLDSGANTTFKNIFESTALMLFIINIHYGHSFNKSELTKLLTRLQSEKTDIGEVLKELLTRVYISAHSNISACETIIEALLSINSLTNENHLVYVLSTVPDLTLNQKFTGIVKLLLSSPLNLNIKIEERTVFEWVCQICNDELIKYCFDKNKHNEDVLIKCINMGKHKETLMELLNKLHIKKTIHFNLYL